MSIFSVRVKQIMSEKKLTQKKVSELSGVSEASLCRYLGGAEPRMDIVANVASALGVTVNYLLGETECFETEDAFVETRKLVARNKNILTDEQKTELIKILFSEN